MSAFTIASAAVALPARACASTRRAAAPAARVNLSGARLASAPARAAARRDRGAALVVRMATPGSNPNLDRENPELEEKFAVIGSGEHQCQSCLYIYDPKKGDPEYPVSAGVQFKALPEDWLCPTCGAAPKTFKNLGKEVAGFEQNQGYGLGANSMSGGDKSVLIYGALAVFFALFLGGYLLD